MDSPPQKLSPIALRMRSTSRLSMGPLVELTRRRCVQDSRTYWFNASSLEAEDEFMLIGLVLGLAVYNAVLLDFPLPIALYRKLLGQPTALRDLKEMDPPLGKSLQLLLDLPGESKPSWASIFLRYRCKRFFSTILSQTDPMCARKMKDQAGVAVRQISYVKMCMLSSDLMQFSWLNVYALCLQSLTI